MIIAMHCGASFVSFYYGFAWGIFICKQKTYIFHISTFPKSICDKTTAKKCISLQSSFLDVETAFRFLFPSRDEQCLPLAIPEFFLFITWVSDYWQIIHFLMCGLGHYVHQQWFDCL